MLPEQIETQLTHKLSRKIHGLQYPVMHHNEVYTKEVEIQCNGSNFGQTIWNLWVTLQVIYSFCQHFLNFILETKWKKWISKNLDRTYDVKFSLKVCKDRKRKAKNRKLTVFSKPQRESLLLRVLLSSLVAVDTHGASFELESFL